MTGLIGKTAIITGSNSGIGPDLVKGFAGAGANVVVRGFADADEIEATQIELDIPVDNAGVQHVSLVEEISRDRLDMNVDINMNSAVRTARAAVQGVMGMTSTPPRTSPAWHCR